MEMLGLCVLALAAGPLLHRAARAREWLRSALDGFVLVAVAGLVLLHIVPHAVEVAGIWCLGIVLLGLLSPLFIERWLTNLAPQAHAAALFVGLFGLVLHNMVDGIGLVEAPHGDTGHSLAWAIVVHQIPVGLMVWWLLRPLYGAVVASTALGALAVATAGGYFFGTTIASSLESREAAMVQALVAGSLLHVIAHRSHAGVGVKREAWKIQAGLGGLAGLALLLAIGGTEGDGHAHSHGFTDTFLAFAIESSPALLLAYLVAGVIQVILPGASLSWLGKGGPLSQSLRGVTFGLPLPICSCGVVPVYRSLMLQRVPAAAALAFLVATPELGVDAVFLSVSLLGRDMAIVRLVGAALVAVLIGWVLGRFANRKFEAPLAVAAEAPPDAATSRPRWVRALRIATFDLVDSTGPWIVFGIAIAAVVAPAVPFDWLSGVHPLLQVPLFALVGMPMYVCASGATPLVAVLLAKGATPGAALAFLLTGPATNVTTFGMLSKFHGRRFALIFALFMFGVTTAVGWLVNLTPVESRPYDVAAHHHDSPDTWQSACAIIMLALMLFSFVRQGPRGFIGQIFSLTRLEGDDGSPQGAGGHSHGHTHDHDVEKPCCHP